jgi:NTE family protein
MSKALVLGGGGPVGVAWEAGLVAGLAEAGVDLSDADRIVGTSAGSIVGARLALGASPAELLAATRPVAPPTSGPAVPVVDGEALMAVGVAMFEALTGGRAHDEIIGDLGRLAAKAETIPEDDFVATVGSDLGTPWPDRDYACTAFDVDSGAFTVWDAGSGVPLDRAVASSCAVPGILPPITIDGRRYMDGGVISGTNAGLTEGHDVVVIVSCITRVVLGAEAYLRAPLDAEVAALRDGGSVVEVVEFDDATIAATGGNLMDFSAETVQAVGATGLAQGRSEAGRIGAVWRGE